MKLNHDCIRDLLLELEVKLEPHKHLSYPAIKDFNTCKKYSLDDVTYSISKLKDAGYLIASLQNGLDGLYNLTVDGITWEGHKFLDTIRDNKIWRDTKSVASKLSSVPISMLSTISTTLLTQFIKQQTGGS
ncbi:DUF2513 domain-containing protein [Listeria booriae]|uniref:DUF2513 domain-containing protein n=1 Tax=Listeria booriae TaxID=1552123 RepID=UPI001627155D|nr:DUF2513 domain-containing protein [Listeria booriae]MBC2023298.1 DUF2513 domain-containing protein [Listeria booriae]